MTKKAVLCFIWDFFGKSGCCIKQGDFDSFDNVLLVCVIAKESTKVSEETRLVGANGEGQEQELGGSPEVAI